MANTGIPVVTIPDTGDILGRPRKEACYDTEGWDSGAVIASKISIFRDSTRFTNSSLVLTKKKFRDSNLDQQTGLAKGQHLHWYWAANKMRYLSANMFQASGVTAQDVKRRIRETTWWSFYFSNSALFFQVQTWQIAERCDIQAGHTTYPATTLVAPSSQELDRENCTDITMNGVPTDIGQEENFHVDIESNFAGATAPTPTYDLYNTVLLGGYFLRGIQG